MKKHFAINIGRQIGSGGRAVAKIVSEKLNINVYDRKLLKTASDQTGFSEEHFEKADEESSRNPLRSLIFANLGNGSMAKNYMSNESLFAMQSDAIRQIHEQEDCIFIGRCADYTLRDSDMTLNVFLAATPNDRIRRICNIENCSEDKARSIMNDADKKRSSYYNYYTDKKWGDSSSYDICLNTSTFGYEKCADIIIELAKNKFGL